MARPGSRDSPSGRSPSSVKRSRLSSPTGGSPGGPGSIQSSSSIVAARLAGGHGTLRSDTMGMDLDEPHRDRGGDRGRDGDRDKDQDGDRDRHREPRRSSSDRHHREREHRSDRDRHHRDRERGRERDQARDRHSKDRSRDGDRERTRDRERAREHGRDRDHHDSRDRRDRERGRDWDGERGHSREQHDRERLERSERPRSSSRPIDDRERSSTPTTGVVATPETAPTVPATITTQFIPADTSKATIQPTTFTPVKMTPQAPRIQTPISLSLTSNTSATSAPRAISAAFGDSDVIRKRRENVLQWRLEREAAKKAEEVANSGESTQRKPLEVSGKDKESFVKVAADASTPVALAAPSKPWSWDDDDDEEDVNAAGRKDPSVDTAMDDAAEDETAKEVDTAMEEDEVDPLDAFMVDVTAEVQQLEKKEQKRDAKAMKTPGGANTDNGSSSNPVGNDEDEEEELEESSEEEDILAMAAKRIKKKDIPAVDHSKIQYEYFRKNFYLEPPEMAEMTPEEVHSLRLELDGIKIRGADCPKPIRKWTQAGLPPGCMQVIKDKLNYAAPTSIQCQAIPAIMSGRDVIAVAKTGSGKTIAFILPMLRHIKDQRPLENMEGPIAIIMTPTRELAVQIHKECKNFLKVLNLRAVCAYGGSPIKDQIAELKRGAEIVVCTPGRLIDLLCANSGRVTNLRRTTFLVLDEADRMFDMGFEPQVMKIVQNVRPQRQVVLFSATFPKQMEALARKLLKRPLEITVGARSVVAEDVTQVVEVREDDASKYNRLLDILGKAYNDDMESRVLIFVSRQEAADDLLRRLVRSGYVSMTIHGGKDQVDRDSAISDFKSGVCQILIATSVAARGLDVKKLGIVINYDCPNHMEDYVHRVGRTGRAGNKGIAYTFILPEQERFASDIAKALTNSSIPVPAELQALVDSFHEKIKSGDAKQTASGFGGKGLEKFEKERDKVLAIQKKTYGAEDEEEGSDGEGGDRKELVLDVKQVQPGITAGKAAAAAGTTAAGDDTADPKSNVAPGASAAGKATAPGGPSDALRKAKEAAIALSQSLGGDAKQRAMEVINNLNRSRPGAGSAADASGSSGANGATGGSGGGGAGGAGGSHRDSGFALEIEINGYPQMARLMVTQKMMINQISDHSGAAITTRGVFVEKDKQPPPGERKLYLFVEGDSQLVVDKAKNEIQRILQEETMRAVDATNRGGGPGRGGAGRFQI